VCEDQCFILPFLDKGFKRFVRDLLERILYDDIFNNVILVSFVLIKLNKELTLLFFFVEEEVKTVTKMLANIIF
jgi:hypothetical protein